MDTNDPTTITRRWAGGSGKGLSEVGARIALSKYKKQYPNEVFFLKKLEWSSRYMVVGILPKGASYWLLAYCEKELHMTTNATPESLSDFLTARLAASYARIDESNAMILQLQREIGQAEAQSANMRETLISIREFYQTFFDIMPVAFQSEDSAAARALGDEK